jgi:hypothetical protein
MMPNSRQPQRGYAHSCGAIQVSDKRADSFASVRAQHHRI